MNGADAMKPTYTLREAAQALGRSERYVWAAAGPTIHRPGGGS